MRALKRLATLERQLQRYLAQHQHLPPSKSARSAKFRATLKRHVVTQNIRNQRCLRAQGNEIGWRGTRLTPADQQRIEALLTATEPA